MDIAYSSTEHNTIFIAAGRKLYPESPFESIYRSLQMNESLFGQFFYDVQSEILGKSFYQLNIGFACMELGGELFTGFDGGAGLVVTGIFLVTQEERYADRHTRIQVA